MSKGGPESQPNRSITARDVSEAEGSLLDPNSPMFAAFAKLAQNSPNNPAVEGIKELVTDLIPKLEEIVIDISAERKQIGRERFEAKQREEEAAKSGEEARALGSDWYKLKVIGGSGIKVSPGSVKRRGASFHQGLPELPSSQRLRVIEAFQENFSLKGESDSRSLKYLISMKSGTVQQFPAAPVAGAISKGKISMDTRTNIFLNGIVDTHPEPKTFARNLGEYFFDKQRHNELFMKYPFISSTVLARALNSYYDSLNPAA